MGAIACATMLHLVRHADAGSRQAWTGDDFQRPLDTSGRAQARAIAEALKGRPVRRILSSPAARCVDTVEPLAEALRMSVTTTRELAEGASLSDALSLIDSLAAAEGDSVLCSHGDVIPGVVWRLARRGLEIPDSGKCKKASIWELHARHGAVFAAVYRHPRTFVAG